MDSVANIWINTTIRIAIRAISHGFEVAQISCIQHLQRRESEAYHQQKHEQIFLVRHGEIAG
jgi:hypothetical protein